MDQADIKKILTKVSDLANVVALIGNKVSNLEKSSTNLEKKILNLEKKSSNGDQKNIRTGSLIHQLAESITGITGLKESLTTENRYLKYTWIFLLFLGILATVLFLFGTANEYIQTPTVTKVNLRSSLSYAYPPLVFCNDAWFDTDKVQNLGLSIDALKYSLGYLKVTQKQKVTNVTTARKEFFDSFHQHNFTSLVDFYKAIATDMQPVTFANLMNTTTSHTYLEQHGYPQIKKVILPSAAVCYAFSLKPAKSRLGVLYEKEGIFVKFLDKTNHTISVLRKWQLSLSTDVETYYSWPLFLKTSTNIALKIKAQRFISLNKFEAPCVHAHEVPENYSAGICMIECSIKHTANELKCKEFWYSNENTRLQPDEVCNFFDQNFNRTVSDERMKILEHTAEDICFEHCPNKCDRILYEAMIEVEEDDWDFKRQTARNIQNRSFVNVNIRHYTMNQGGLLTFTEVSSYSFVELVNNIGGTLGLFVGGTLMTLVQISLFFVSYYCDRRGEIVEGQGRIEN